MTTAYEQGPLTQYSAYAAGIIPPDVLGIAINWFVNRTPLISRLPKVPVGSPNFLITRDNYRPRSVAIATIADNSNTTITITPTTSGAWTVSDSSIFDVGDVVQVESEYMLVTSPGNNTGNNTIVVTRGYAGSSATSHANTAAMYLVGNSRTGAETEVKSVSRIPQTQTQWCQTVQHVYQVGGSLQADTNYVTGFASPLDRDRMLAMQHVMDDFESSCYYGPGVALTGGSASTRPVMYGLNNLIVTNNTTSPTNAAAYKPSDLVRDTIQKAFDNGGNPNFLLVSTDFLTGFGVWGSPLVRLDAGATVFGVAIDQFEAPFLDGITVVPAPLLRAGTAICLAEPEIRVRLKRPMFDKPRGSRGDATEGDIIMEGAIELDNEAHHAYVSGITGFAAA